MTRNVIARVERPNGQIEEVNLTAALGLKGMTQPLFEQIRRDTATAGKGNVLSYEIRTDLTAAEEAYREVARLRALAERAMDNAAEYLRREEAARQAYAAWAAAYPTEAKARTDEARRHETERREAAKVSDPYNL